MLGFAEDGARGADGVGHASFMARVRLLEHHDAGERPESGQDSQNDPEPRCKPEAPAARQRRSPTR
ncbi:MAG: hypothetical protein DMD91_14260 [Candidatus Rokuibacteriota bacterium]|nr:MAG: hypothetical protein DMD91_14260 [Candidatus Rokubacteria bacterium]